MEGERRKEEEQTRAHLSSEFAEAQDRDSVRLLMLNRDVQGGHALVVFRLEARASTVQERAVQRQILEGGKVQRRPRATE